MAVTVAGGGAMGRVYRAFQKGIERDVAVKILHRELSANAQLVARFHREAKVASRLLHPTVVQIHLAGQLPDLLAGKVVLIDFWATWCGPCREALPHIRRIAQKFAGQPFVVLSVSLDNDASKWKDFVAKNEMTWFQYRDGGFEGPMAKMFSVDAIPATFSIDADGVLEDQHVGDENIEGKLKKMIAHAAETENAKPAPPAASQAEGSGN